MNKDEAVKALLAYMSHVYVPPELMEAFKVLSEPEQDTRAEVPE